MKTTFIYALKELKPGEFFSTKIRYIGKADDPYGRFERHCRTKEKTHCGNWIRSLPAKGMSLQLEILDEVPDVKSVWGFWEREYIKVFRAIGFSLVNGTAGGEGSVNPTAETRAKMRAAHLGKRPSEETRRKMSLAGMGKHRATGYKHSDEARQKISAGNLGKIRTEETRRKISEGHRGICRPHTVETRAKMRASRSNKIGTHSRSGFVGVSWAERPKKWIADFNIATRKKKYVGSFLKIEDAVFARALAMDKYFSHVD